MEARSLQRGLQLEVSTGSGSGRGSLALLAPQGILLYPWVPGVLFNWAYAPPQIGPNPDMI